MLLLLLKPRSILRCSLVQMPGFGQVFSWHVVWEKLHFGSMSNSILSLYIPVTHLCCLKSKVWQSIWAFQCVYTINRLFIGHPRKLYVLQFCSTSSQISQQAKILGVWTSQRVEFWPSHNPFATIWDVKALRRQLLALHRRRPFGSENTPSELPLHQIESVSIGQ